MPAWSRGGVLRRAVAGSRGWGGVRADWAFSDRGAEWGVLFGEALGGSMLVGDRETEREREGGELKSLWVVVG